MIQKTKQLQAQNPLILRCHRLMEAFAKSDDERDFYLDRLEGFLLYADLEKPEEELAKLEKELELNKSRYVSIPKMTFYETKKIMEGFVNEKVYDIDTKEKLLEIIQSKEARDNFLEFIYDHHSELEKWQQYYQERSRIRIIEWLRQNQFEFVFEEDLDLPKEVTEKMKIQLFDSKAHKDVLAARKTLLAKAKTYYSSEALNPRPKRGRPPKQVAKAEIEPQMTADLYTTVPGTARPFLFMPDYSHGSFVIFSQKFESEEQLLARKKAPSPGEFEANVESLSEKLSAIRNLSNRWIEEEKAIKKGPSFASGREVLDDEEEGLDDEKEEKPLPKQKKVPLNDKKQKVPAKALPKVPSKKSVPPKKNKSVPPKQTTAKKATTKSPAKKIVPPKKIAPKTATKSSAKKSVKRK